METIHTVAVAEPESAPPDRASLPPRQWLRQNLFSSPSSTALTVLFAVFGLWLLRGLLNFIFSEEREWDAIRVNMRLFFTHAYPQDQYARVWVSVGAIAVLAGLSLGLSARFGVIKMRRLSIWVTVGGALIALGTLLRQPSVLVGEDGERLRDTDDRLIRESFANAMWDRVTYWLIAVVLLGVGLAIWYGLGDKRRRSIGVPAVPFAFAVLGVLVASAWLYRWGHYGFVDGYFIYEPGRTVATTTKVPWTVMWLLLVGAWLVGKTLQARPVAQRIRVMTNVTWLLLPFLLYWVVLRDPDLDWAHIWSTDVPMALAFAGGGGAVLWLLTRASAGEFDRVIAVLLLLLALFHWVAAFFGWYPMLQKARLSFLLLGLAALAAPNFVGVRGQRLRLIGAWIAAMALFHYLVTLINAPSTIVTPTASIMGGFSITLLVAVFTLLLSFPLGVLLALARTSKLPIFRMLSTSYIETVRGIPLITILIFFSIMVPLFLPEGMELAELAAMVTGYVLFSAAYLAEYMRGGLQWVRRGQYEASDAVGLSIVQRTTFVVVPQALRVSIPALVGQVIATFKETSLIAIVGGFDFLRIANNVIPNQSEFLGVKREGLLFVSVIYWVVAFTMSKYSQRLERRVGLGDR